MDIKKATRKYEKWVGQFLPLVGPDLEYKHAQMRSERFAFFRATFYRWMQSFDKLDGPMRKAPTLLAVGDLHVENFGTWRDAEARLVWGVNDFDEAAILPYTNDLVRLASSILFAIQDGHLKLDAKTACAAMVEGYSKALATGGKPLVLEADHLWLRRLATGVERAPDRFWEKLNGLPALEGSPLAAGTAAVHAALPNQDQPVDYRSRRAGLGSLGHPRYVGLQVHQGAQVAREAKLLAPSSVGWAAEQDVPSENLYAAILHQSVRCRDPFVTIHGMWVVRRLAPSCSRIELSELPQEREEDRLIEAMGFELGNIHLGTPTQIEAVKQHLASLPKKWLKDASQAMADQMVEDFEAFAKDD